MDCPFCSALAIGLRISLVAELALAESMDCGAGALASASARKECGRLLTSRRMEVWLDIRDLSDVSPAGDRRVSRVSRTKIGP